MLSTNWKKNSTNKKNYQINSKLSFNPHMKNLESSRKTNNALSNNSIKGLWRYKRISTTKRILNVPKLSLFNKKYK